ncbi:hypothetical protein Ahy_A09g042648 [Arachis hypogaea]|uniref:SWIM-type domain-containing protein n=1 Tax=Arachis hypogaea TaxID=3818 RepID=A0A445BGG1_ARAHY|nr:hypothetical protein Ahy_A09g042648 [Arachis hypogaea]
MATVDKNRDGIPKMRVTFSDSQGLVFVIEELDPFESWSQSSFCARVTAGTCDCGLFQSLHYQCQHAHAACADVSIEWALYVHPVYMQDAAFKVYEM